MATQQPRSPVASPTASSRTILVRTSSGTAARQSVGHLGLSPAGFAKLHRPDVVFSLQDLLFPVHSLLLAVSSRFFTDFFSFIKGQRAEVIALDAVKSEALTPASLAAYLHFAYSGCLPPIEETPEAVELLRLSAFFGNAPLTAQLTGHLAGLLGGMREDEVLQVFRAAVELKLRLLVAECLALLLPRQGRRAGGAAVVEAVVDAMDVELSKAVLTQLAMHGAGVSRPPSLRCSSEEESGSPGTGSIASLSDDGEVSLSSITLSPHSPGHDAYAGTPSLGGSSYARGSSLGGSSLGGSSSRSYEAGSIAAAATGMKSRFVEVLEARGWGQ